MWKLEVCHLSVGNPGFSRGFLAGRWPPPSHGPSSGALALSSRHPHPSRCALTPSRGRSARTRPPAAPSADPPAAPSAGPAAAPSRGPPEVPSPRPSSGALTRSFRHALSRSPEVPSPSLPAATPRRRPAVPSRSFPWCPRGVLPHPPPLPRSALAHHWAFCEFQFPPLTGMPVGLE